MDVVCVRWLDSDDDRLRVVLSGADGVSDDERICVPVLLGETDAFTDSVSLGVLLVELEADSFRDNESVNTFDELCVADKVLLGVADFCCESVFVVDSVCDWDLVKDMSELFVAVRPRE